MKPFIQSLCHSLANNRRVVVATVISHEGSTPREAGAKMLVLDNDDTFGTIGGGRIEAEVISKAKKRLHTLEAEIIHFDMGGQDVDNRFDTICGGSLNVLLEPVGPDSKNLRFYRQLQKELAGDRSCLFIGVFPEKTERPFLFPRAIVTDKGIVQEDDVIKKDLADEIRRSIDRQTRPFEVKRNNMRFLVEPFRDRGALYLFGAGHVSQEVAPLASRNGFSTVVIDDREEFCNPQIFKTADKTIVIQHFDDVLTNLDIDKNSCLIIITRGHSHDKTVLAKALKTDAAYIGMIGSRRKRDMIYTALMKEGFSQRDLDRVHCPIGLAIGAETPAEIAVSIVAELIRHRAAGAILSQKGASAGACANAFGADLPKVRKPKQVAAEKIESRIEIARGIIQLPSQTLDDLNAARRDRDKWNRYNEYLLSHLFDSKTLVREYKRSLAYGKIPQKADLNRLFSSFRDGIQNRIAVLESILERLALMDEVQP